MSSLILLGAVDGVGVKDASFRNSRDKNAKSTKVRVKPQLGLKVRVEMQLPQNVNS